METAPEALTSAERTEKDAPPGVSCTEYVLWFSSLWKREIKRTPTVFQLRCCDWFKVHNESKTTRLKKKCFHLLGGEPGDEGELSRQLPEPESC